MAVTKPKVVIDKNNFENRRLQEVRTQKKSMNLDIDDTKFKCMFVTNNGKINGKQINYKSI